MYTIDDPLIFAGLDAKGSPTFKMNQYQDHLATGAFTPNISAATVWGMQLGLRYSF
jgi:hypothetical protein